MKGYAPIRRVPANLMTRLKSSDGRTRDAFKLSNVDGSLVHSTRLVLVDRQSRIRRYYTTSDDDPAAQVVRDIKRVLAERS